MAFVRVDNGGVPELRWFPEVQMVCGCLKCGHPAQHGTLLCELCINIGRNPHLSPEEIQRHAESLPGWCSEIRPTCPKCGGGVFKDGHYCRSGKELASKENWVPVEVEPGMPIVYTRRDGTVHELKTRPLRHMVPVEENAEIRNGDVWVVY